MITGPTSVATFQVNGGYANRLGSHKIYDQFNDNLRLGFRSQVDSLYLFQIP